MVRAGVSGCVGVMGSGNRMALGIPVELQSSCSICVFVGVHQSSSLACLVLDLEIEIIHVFLLAGLMGDVLCFCEHCMHGGRVSVRVCMAGVGEMGMALAGARHKLQMRNDFTTLRLYNYSLKSKSGDYKCKQLECFACPVQIVADKYMTSQRYNSISIT